MFSFMAMHCAKSGPRRDSQTAHSPAPQQCHLCTYICWCHPCSTVQPTSYLKAAGTVPCRGLAAKHKANSHPPVSVGSATCTHAVLSLYVHCPISLTPVPAPAASSQQGYAAHDLHPRLLLLLLGHRCCLVYSCLKLLVAGGQPPAVSSSCALHAAAHCQWDPQPTPQWNPPPAVNCSPRHENTAMLHEHDTHNMHGCACSGLSRALIGRPLLLYPALPAGCPYC
jgi:hypothetical protein